MIRISVLRTAASIVDGFSYRSCVELHARYLGGRFSGPVLAKDDVLRLRLLVRFIK